MVLSGNLLAPTVTVTSGTILMILSLTINNIRNSSSTAKTATKWVQDYVSSFYNDPEHTMEIRPTTN